MMKLSLNELTPTTFLAQYWQKKPLVIRQGLVGFSDFLTPDELAGLASVESVESRRIYRVEDETGAKGKWQAEFGPFDSYEHLGDRDWTLVVQALNHWVPDVDKLIQCFDFIPRWRFDDVMASYAAPGGSVGPHIDAYDVFICQGAGSRRWLVGDTGVYQEFAAHSDLRHTQEFEAVIDVVLFSGDILYIPPGFPHDGIAQEASMSYSVGYRTASARDLHNSLSDYLIDNDLATDQIADPDRQPSRQSGKIDTGDFSRFRTQLLDALDDGLIRQVVGTLLTNSKCALDLPVEELCFDSEYVVETLKQQDIIRLGGLRCLYFGDGDEEGVFYLNGERVTWSRDLTPLLQLFCDYQSLSYEQLSPWLDNKDVLDQLTEWLNRGYWYFDDGFVGD